MKLIKIGELYINPEKIIALCESLDKARTNIFVGGDENDYFQVHLHIADVAAILEKATE